MGRYDFVKKIIRVLLFLIVAVAGIILGSKAVAGRSCDRCPGYGKCSGRTDCSNY